MKPIAKYIPKRTLESLIKTALVAGLVLALIWALVQIANFNDKPESDTLQHNENQIVFFGVKNGLLNSESKVRQTIDPAKS